MNVLAFLTVFACILGGVFLCARIVSVRKMDLRALFVSFVVSLVALVPQNAVVVGAVEVAAIWLISLFFFSADRRKALLVACIYKMGNHLLTFLACASLAVFTEDESCLDTFSFRGCLISLFVSLIILIVCLFSFYRHKITGQIWFRVLMLVSLLALFYINMLMVIDSPMLDREILYVMMYYDTGILLSGLLTQMRSQYETEKELARMKSEEAMMLEREYSALSSSYERNAKLFHDFRNHCGVIRNYLAGGKSEEAVSYIDELMGEGSSYGGEVFTGEGTIDYLIGSKKALAGEKGISLEVNAEFPRNINIKSSDLCAMLGNLLDNAVEAASGVSDPSERKIRLIIRRIGQMLVIKVENTFKEKPVAVDGEYKTIKKDGDLHGWGIKSVKTAAEKYDGTVVSNVTDDIFSTVVTLSFEGIRQE